ncbi:MAG: hypothetical protein IJS03_09135 [Eubacterium sp.]|nr:hypothetical protein [Eubacterium sp.]
MKTLLKKATAFLLSLILIISANALSAGAIDNGYTDDDFSSSISSTNSSAPEYNINRVKIGVLKSNRSMLYINYSSVISAIEYRLSLTKISSVASQRTFYGIEYYDAEITEDNDANLIYGFETVVDITATKYTSGTVFENGYYYLQITRARDENQLDHQGYGDGGNCYRNVPVKLTNNEIEILDYPDVITNNNKYKSSADSNNPDYYLDTTMEDTPTCLYNLIDEKLDSRTPSSLPNEKQSLTTAQRNKIKEVAQRLTSGVTDDYQKVMKLYKYVCTNVFYDTYSHEHVDTVKTINNPYVNINKIENGKNAYTACIGYASMITALVRSLGIPARVIYGYHVHVPEECWESIGDLTNRREDEHYWAQFYYKNRWVTVDCNMGTSNKWYRNDRSLGDNGFVGGNAGEKSINNYTFFDPTDSQLATSHRAVGVYSKAVIKKRNDVEKLAAFLNTKNSSGKTNAAILGSNKTFDATKAIYSWDLERLYGNNYTGELEKIDFADASSTLTGAADFSNCKGLRRVSLSRNTGVTSLDVSGDSELISVYASSAGIKNAVATGCKSLEVFNLGYNPLKSAKYTFNTSKTASIEATTGGTFFVNYDGAKHSMKAYANDHYYLSGWYNSSGKKLASNAEYSTTTKSSFTYKVKFVKLKAPTNLKVKILSPTGHKLTWDKVSGADGYYVYKGESKNGPFALVNLAGANNTSVEKTGLTTGKNYYYYVVSYKKVSGASYTTYSEPTAIVTKKVLPPTPSVTLSTAKKTITVKFPKIFNVTGYEIYRATSSGGTYKKIKTINQQSVSPIKFENKKLKKGKKYYYKVRAFRTVGSKKVYSAYSKVKSITCK